MRSLPILLALFACLSLLLCASAPARAAGLTADERRWIDIGAPVLAEAEALGLPLDIVVQPQAAAGETPVAMAYVDGRCKLVFTLRSNPEAEALLAAAPSGMAEVVMQAVLAHEVGHCWRHAQGGWQPRAVGDWREEAYADLAALAWTATRHPGRYADFHAWLLTLRDAHAGSAHDTRRVLRTAAEPARFAAQPGSAFAQAQALWRQALAVAPSPAP